MIISILKESSKTKSALILIFWLLVWQIVYVIIGKDVIVPSPADTFVTLSQLLMTQGFYQDVSATMSRVIAGIIISFAAGLGTAIAAHLLFIVKDIMGFAVNILKSTPVMAVIIFALLWLPSGNVPIFVCFLMCYPIVYTNILTGVESLSKDYIEMSQIYRIRKRDLVRSIYIPFVAPHIKAALSLTTGLSWKTVVAAEVLASPTFSMGYNLLNAKVYLDTESLFAWIIAIVALSMAFEKIVNGILHKGKKGAYDDRSKAYI
ncbi:MAG: ABC transporter permease subunit [Peptostreptococcaceae bacterium]|nr:ABC transporter permease subunit [Peptostreptococcaceae bacterium]